MSSLVHTARARSLPVAMLAAVLCLVGVPSATAQPWPNTHQGWFLGFGVGAGSAQLKLNDDVFTSGPRSERDGGGAGSFRFGYDFTPQLGLGLESSAWVKSETDQGVDFMTTIGVSAATLYYHPENTGVVLKGGVGLGTYRVSASEGNVSLSASESAFGLLAGMAYEFRVKRSFSIGPEVTFGWAPFDEFSTTHLNAGLSFDWHFIPR